VLHVSGTGERKGGIDRRGNKIEYRIRDSLGLYTVGQMGKGGGEPVEPVKVVKQQTWKMGN
jgi:hypothetical protein